MTGNEFIFPGAKPGKALSARIIERHIAGIASTAGIHRIVTCMVLRHSYAVECLRAGMSVRQLRQNLGHVFIRSTLIYQHCLLPSSTVSPADALSHSDEVHASSDPDQESTIPDQASYSAICPGLPAIVGESIPLPFPSISSGARDYFAMLKTRLRNRFLTMKAYINTA